MVLRKFVVGMVAVVVVSAWAAGETAEADGEQRVNDLTTPGGNAAVAERLRADLDAYEAAKLVRSLIEAGAGPTAVEGIGRLIGSLPKDRLLYHFVFAVCDLAKAHPVDCKELLGPLRDNWLTGLEFAQTREVVWACGALTAGEARDLSAVLEEREATGFMVSAAGALHVIREKRERSEAVVEGLVRLARSDEDLVLRTVAAEVLVALAADDPRTVTCAIDLLEDANGRREGFGNVEELVLQRADLTREESLAVAVRALATSKGVVSRMIARRLAIEGHGARAAVPAVLEAFRRELADKKRAHGFHEYSRCYLKFFEEVGGDDEVMAYLTALSDPANELYEGATTRGSIGSVGFQAHLLLILAKNGRVDGKHAVAVGQMLKMGVSPRNNATAVAAVRAARQIPEGGRQQLLPHLHAMMEQRYADAVANTEQMTAYWIVDVNAHLQIEVMRTLMAFGPEALKGIEGRLREIAQAERRKEVPGEAINVSRVAKEALEMLGE